MRIAFISVAAMAAFQPFAFAQSDLSCNGFADVLYVGQQVQDFLVPNISGAQVFFTVQGADGGRAIFDGTLPGDDSNWPGGEGAQAVIGCVIGTDSGQLIPGGTIRFIVGQRGSDESSGGLNAATGGGGGGSAVLYLPPSGDWATNGVILAAAGGGGGANGTASGADGPGGQGLAGECGGDFFCDDNTEDGAGGCNGFGGDGRFAGGGGGAIGNGEHSSLDPNINGRLGFPAGGRGGFGTNSIAGGWGFGGGGAGRARSGGGGGGYSGGATSDGNGVDDCSTGGGRGGGSFINLIYASGSWGTLEGFSAISDDGFAQYIITNNIPNSQAHNPFPVFDDVPISGSFCGAEESGAWSCGPAIDGADLWYIYTNASDCAPMDIMITVTTGDAEIQSYNSLIGVPSSIADCRGSSTNGIYIDMLGPGQTIRFRVQSMTGSDFVFTASSTFTAGLPDCDGNGIPDSCDIAANPGLDCNGNGRPDSCDIADGLSQDCDGDGIPDECDPSNDCPPANDDIANAITVVDGTYFYDLGFGTIDGSASCEFSGLDADIWYTITAPSSGQLVVEQVVGGAAFEDFVSLSLFNDVGVELACNSTNPLPGASSRIAWTMASGETVLIRVDGFAVDSGFNITVGEISVVFHQGLTNDQCDGAIAVATDTAYPYDPNELAYDDTVSTSCTSPSDRLDLWFEYTSLAGGMTRFRTDQLWSSIAVFDTCGGNELGCDVGESLPEGGSPPAIDLDLMPGQTVTIRVAATAFLESGNFYVEDIGQCGEADLTGDGDLNFFDVSAFLVAFAANDSVADFTGDGEINFFDVSAFLSAFAAGCP